MSETPRTDRALLDISPANGVYQTAFYRKVGYSKRPQGIVDADDMRQLEREFSAAQAQIAALIKNVSNKTEILERYREQIATLGRGEYICKKCGLRKDSEHGKGDF